MSNLQPSSLSVLNRRMALRLLGGSAAALLVTACGGGGTDGSVDSSTGTSSGGGSTSGCTEIPSETNGPFPADGSQSGVTNVLNDSRILRSSIVTDLSGSNVQGGVPLTLTITVADTGSSCGLLEGAAVYVWHCNADGDYSVYGSQSSHTFLRGVQVTDSNGQVTFTTVYPGHYDGRAPHIHVEVYSDTSFNTLLKTSQFAFAESVSQGVYTDSAYAGDDAAFVSNSSDGIFRDGYDDELLTLSGSNSAGYAASITMGIAAS